MKKTLFRNWPLYAAIATFLVVMWLAINVSLRQNKGHLVYASDDNYIAMAVARNFAQYGVFGVTRYGFTSSSSTLLWTLLLSLTYFLGAAEQLAPLGWNLAFAMLVLVAAYAVLSWYRISATVSFVALLSIVLLLPLPALVLAGMEHTLQTLLSILTVFLGARLISGEAPGCARRDAVWLLLLAPAVTATRFEGMFLIATLCGLFLLRKRWRFALGLGVGGSLPVVIHGIISVSHGWFWFPASVLLKASLPDSHSGAGFFLSIVNPIFVNVRQSPHELVLLVAVLLVYILADGKGSGAGESRQVMGAVLAVLWVSQLEFVGGGSMYRYDACLCGLTILWLAVQLPVIAPSLSLWSWATWRVPKNLAAAALALALFFPLAYKGGELLWFLPQCTTNIFEQQYQMGLFVREYYQGSAVALNDIGAVDYLADIHCVDLMGLAIPEVAAARRKDSFHTQEMQNLAKQTGARIAIVYDEWFPGLLPSEWIRVGRWTIRKNVIAAKDTVSFYAINPGEAEHLVESLRDFSSQLPADVIQRGP